jgi:hypothetical protein
MTFCVLLAGLLFALSSNQKCSAEPLPLSSASKKDTPFVRVYVEFTIREDGIARDIKVVKTDKHCDTCSASTVRSLQESAMRLVQKMPPWTEAKRKKPVIFTLPVKVLVDGPPENK